MSETCNTISQAIIHFISADSKWLTSFFGLQLRCGLICVQWGPLCLIDGSHNPLCWHSHLGNRSGDDVTQWWQESLGWGVGVGGINRFNAREQRCEHHRLKITSRGELHQDREALVGHRKRVCAHCSINSGVCLRGHTVVLFQGQRVRALHVEEWVSSNKCLHGLLLSAFTWLHCKTTEKGVDVQKLFLASKFNKAPKHVRLIPCWTDLAQRINYTLVILDIHKIRFFVSKAIW